jgi:hypothetical protein
MVYILLPWKTFISCLKDITFLLLCRLNVFFTAVICYFVQWVEAMQKFQEAAELVDAENRMKKTMWGQFWSSHQRFFKYLCIAAKVNHAVVTAR